MHWQRPSIRPPRSRCRAPGSGLRSPARRSRASAGLCCDEPHQQDAQGPGQAPCAPARNSGARGGTVAAYACGARAHAGFRFLLADHGDVDALRRGLGRVARLAADTAPNSHRSRLPVLAGEGLRAGCIVASGSRSRASISRPAACAGLACRIRIGRFGGSAAAFAAAPGKNQCGHAAAGDRVDDAHSSAKPESFIFTIRPESFRCRGEDRLGGPGARSGAPDPGGAPDRDQTRGRGCSLPSGGSRGRHREYRLRYAARAHHGREQRYPHRASRAAKARRAPGPQPRFPRVCGCALPAPRSPQGGDRAVSGGAAPCTVGGRLVAGLGDLASGRRAAQGRAGGLHARQIGRKSRSRSPQFRRPTAQATAVVASEMQDRYREVYDSFKWEVPARFNIGTACCGRHSADRSRVALYWEDESGAVAVFTFRDLQHEANRLSNALAGLGVKRGDRVAIILPQRPETAIAHIACYQMGAVAMPLSVLFGPDALEYRLENSETVAALVDSGSLPSLAQIRGKLPLLRHVIGVAGARESWVQPWERLLDKASPHFTPIDTAAGEPALLIYTSGTTGPPKGALMPQRVLLGNLPGFEHSHDLFPQAGDVFWSPADWAWTGGLMDALLPSLYHGTPVLGYRGRFDPEKSFWLMQKYGVRNSFLFPTALKMMMKAVPQPGRRYELSLRSIMSAGESLGETVFEWTREALGVTVNEMFGQTEMNYIVGNSHTLWPAKPGSIGRPYPGHRAACIDDAGDEVPVGQLGSVPVPAEGDPVSFLEYWKNPEATREKIVGGWCRTGDLAKRDADGDFWYQGRADDMFKSAGYRIGPSEIENCLVKHPAVANCAVVGSPDPERTHVVKAFIVLTLGYKASAALEAELQQHVRGKLAPYEYPKEIEFTDSLPMTTTGKVQRQVLRLREEERKRSKT